MSRVKRGPLLAVRDLVVAMPRGAGAVLPVDGISFEVEAGRTLGIVGESGSGKSMTLRTILGMTPHPGGVVGGEILWRGDDLLRCDRRAMERIRGSEIAIVPQDPGTSLSPVYTVGDQVAETLRAKRGRGRREARAEAVELLSRVGIPAAARRARDYPHQLSGGMRQRVMIAIAIAAQPALLLADEPTTALDVTVQDQILALLAELQEEMGMAMVLVSHDLAVIEQMSDEIAVMYAGRLVERGARERVVERPCHPYTRALMAAAPDLSQVGVTGRALGGQPPDIGALPPGCPFRQRCPQARDTCAEVDMRLLPAGPAHVTACPVSAPGELERAS